MATVALLRAINKPLWFDEIFTLILARMESPAEIIEALRVPIDALPPPYYMICRATLLLVPDEHFIAAIARGAVLQELSAIARAAGHLPMRHDGLEKVRLEPIVEIGRAHV